jgi:hypothetical protein
MKEDGWVGILGKKRYKHKLILFLKMKNSLTPNSSLTLSLRQ